MSTAVLIIPTKSRGAYHLPDLQDFCATLSTYLQENVGLWMIEEEAWGAVVEGNGRVPAAREDGPSWGSDHRCGADEFGAVRVSR